MTVVIKQTITRTGTGYDARTWRGILKSGWDRVGRFWHRHTLGKHFTVAGASEYMYQPRTVKYSRYKAKRFGHRRPLVFTGDAERAAHRMRDLRTSSKGVNVVLHLPRYFYQYRKYFTGPNKAAELRHISQRDAQNAARVLDRHIQHEIDAGQRTVDITAGHRTGVA